jgi:uncharacterized metal-binding protein YceD (DUF177 family)
MNSDVEVGVPGQPDAADAEEGATTASGRPNPFAVLASLKKDKS